MIVRPNTTVLGIDQWLLLSNGNTLLAPPIIRPDGSFRDPRTGIVDPYDPESDSTRLHVTMQKTDDVSIYPDDFYSAFIQLSTRKVKEVVAIGAIRVKNPQEVMARCECSATRVARSPPQQRL